MPQSLSQLHKQLRQAQQQSQALLADFLRQDPLLPGSLYKLRRRCGKPNCRCVEGQLHESTVLSYRGQAKPQTISPPPEQLDDLQRLTEHYQRFRKARAQLVKLQRHMLDLIDRIETSRRQLGERQFQKRLPGKARKPSGGRP